MTWTSPATATVGQVLTASFMNVNLRDNLLYLRSNAQNFIATSQTTTSATYTDLATVGPSVTVTTDTQAIVLIHSFTQGNTTNEQTYASFTVSGATTIAADDAYSAQWQQFAGGSGITISGAFLITTLTPGSNTFTCKYKTNTGTATFYNRRMTVIPS